MVLDEYIYESWQCDFCGKEGMNKAEFRKHQWVCDEEDCPVENLFPEYNVCRSGDGADVYMKAETEDGPFYMAWDFRDWVDIMPVWGLKHHDWEPIEREETPFPQFES